MPDRVYFTELDLRSPNISFVLAGEGEVRQIEHIHEPVGLGRQSTDPPSREDLKELARNYLKLVRGTPGYNIADYEVNLEAPSSPDDPNSDGTVLRLAEIKSSGNDIVLTLSQSFARIEVWQAGFSLSIYYVPFNKELVVTSSRSTLYLHRDIEKDSTFQLPHSSDLIGPNKISRALLSDLLGIGKASIVNITSTRLLIYKFISTQIEDLASNFEKRPLSDYVPAGLFPLQKPDGVKENEHRAVTEVLFTTAVPGPPDDRIDPAAIPPYELAWQIFLDCKTGCVLYLRAFASGCLDTVFPVPDAPLPGHGAMGTVMRMDPMTLSGKDPFRWLDKDDVDAELLERSEHLPLPNIINSRSEWQSLSGEYIEINTKNKAPYDDNPQASARPIGTTPDFTLDIMDNPVTYTAVNAYYHCTMMFRLMKKLGFDDVMNGYFRGLTNFPILVDPQGTDDVLNALVLGNDSRNGVKKILFGPMQTERNDPGRGIGNACDVRVVLHEFCHELLLSQIHSTSFDFAHSAGDSLAAILCDPESVLRSDQDHRFETFPWVAKANPGLGNERFHGGTVDDRDKMNVWGWNGSRYRDDRRGYLREQVLSLTLFHLYRALGGDSTCLDKRCLASLYTVYLVIKAFQSYSSSGNLSTDDATDLANYMIEVDKKEGKLKGSPFRKIRGGGVHKVIRWAFEKHGLYPHNVPLGSGEPDPKPGEGAPCPVDVYINDLASNGTPRCGEYAPAGDFTTTEIWNRTQVDIGIVPHQNQDPVANVENFLYVNIRNRGYDPAIGVSVKAYFTNQRDSDDLSWDGLVTQGGSWTEMLPDPASFTVQRGEECPVGPFRWDPGPASAGKEIYVLVSVSAPGDPSNIDLNATSVAPSFVAEPIPLWWLVPFDNNIGGRKLTVMQ